LFISNLISPSSLLTTTPTSLIASAGITSIPVLVHLYSSTLTFDIPPLVLTISLGTVALLLSQPSQMVTSQIHRIVFPVATIFSTVAAYLTSTFHIVTLFPAILMFYGVFTIPVSKPSINLWIKFRYHPLLKKILHKEDSRKIFTFLCLNLGFMCIQMGYGIYTNSLGLVSDSIHMLVDCAAIAFGLAASVLADGAPENAVKIVLEGHDCQDHVHGDKHGHPHNHTHLHDHTYNHSQNHEHDHIHHHSHDHNHTNTHNHSHCHGPKVFGKWAKLEDLAGFANGVFLVFVCVSILVEALGRLIWPEEVVEVEQLLIVSILGLAVNLVGVFSFNHGYPYSPPKNETDMM
jgi:Cation efflux family